MICRWILELMARKSTRKLLSAGQYEWECNFFLDLLLSLAPPLFMSQPGVVPPVPAISKQYSRKIYQLQTVVSVNILKASQLACTGTLLTYAQLLVCQDPRSFFAKLFPSHPDPSCTWGYSVPEARLCACPYPILSPSIQYRLFGVITTCHKPHCNGAKIHPTFVVAVPTLRSLGAYKRSITR